MGSVKSYNGIFYFMNAFLTGTIGKPRVSRPVQDEDEAVGRLQISQIGNKERYSLTSRELGGGCPSSGTKVFGGGYFGLAS